MNKMIITCSRCEWEGEEKDLKYFQSMIDDSDEWLECPKCNKFIKWANCVEPEMIIQYFKD